MKWMRRDLGGCESVCTVRRCSTNCALAFGVRAACCRFLRELGQLIHTSAGNFTPLSTAFGLIIMMLVGCVAPLATQAAEPAGEGPAKNDVEYRRLVLGTWEDEYEGKRTMTVRADGTATMVVKLSGLKAALYARQLRFDMVWSITNGRLKKRTIGGEPSGRVKLILKMMGDQVDEPILELTPDRLLLLDQNGKQKYDWRRVPPNARQRLEWPFPALRVFVDLETL